MNSSSISVPVNHFILVCVQSPRISVFVPRFCCLQSASRPCVPGHSNALFCLNVAQSPTPVTTHMPAAECFLCILLLRLELCCCLLYTSLHRHPFRALDLHGACAT